MSISSHAMSQYFHVLQSLSFLHKIAICYVEWKLESTSAHFLFSVTIPNSNPNYIKGKKVFLRNFVTCLYKGEQMEKIEHNLRKIAFV